MLPSPSPSHLQSPLVTPSHHSFPSLSLLISCHPACPPDHRFRHCHCHRQDRSFHCSELLDLLSSHHHHPGQLSHPNCVVQRRGSRVACSASRLAAQSLPCDHRYCTKRNARRCVEHYLSWLSADWGDWLDPQRHWGCPTSNGSFDCGLCQTFGTYISRRQRTTPALVNSCSCRVATSGGIVNSGELWLD